jgi:hypothetical protein
MIHRPRPPFCYELGSTGWNGIVAHSAYSIGAESVECVYLNADSGASVTSGADQSSAAGGTRAQARTFRRRHSDVKQEEEKRGLLRLRSWWQ